MDPLLPVTLLRIASYRWTLVLALCRGPFWPSVIFIPAYIEQYLGGIETCRVTGSLPWPSPPVGAGAGERWWIGAVRSGPAGGHSSDGNRVLLFPFGDSCGRWWWPAASWGWDSASCWGLPSMCSRRKRRGTRRGSPGPAPPPSDRHDPGADGVRRFHRPVLFESGGHDQKRMEDANIPWGNMAHPSGEEMDVAAMQEAFEKIPDPTVREILSSSCTRWSKPGTAACSTRPRPSPSRCCSW